MADFLGFKDLLALLIAAIGVVVSINAAKQQAQASIKAAKLVAVSSSDLRQAFENLYAAETSLKFLARNKTDISDVKLAEDRLAVLDHSLLSLGLQSNLLPTPHQVCETQRNWATARGGTTIPIILALMSMESKSLMTMIMRKACMIVRWKMLVRQ